MNAEEFLSQRLPLPGVAAWALRLANSRILSHCYTDWVSPDQVGQALSRLVLSADGFSYHGIRPTRVCWVFEHARLHLALRSDGACLALFVENRPGAADGKLDELLAEFAGLADV
ncbi:MAG TPA: hypothetical protein VMU04_25465 [Candidatus Acidoferrum sp.]|nr:hypothetical protein [Candidatus Acidoferrum sp.]